MAPLTIETLESELEKDHGVKVAGVDVDGVLRGKLMAKSKFLSVAKDGFGFCSVIFGWDMHDLTYAQELKVSNAENGYRDMIAVPDLSSFRRIPWENNVPFFLVSFLDPDTRKPVCACPRGLLKTALEKVQKEGYGAMAGAEYEFFQYRSPNSDNPMEPNASATAAFLKDNPPSKLQNLTENMCGYSLTRPVHNQEYYYDVFNTCRTFNCGIEGWHTESGPGVFEAMKNFVPAVALAIIEKLSVLTEFYKKALEFGDVKSMADKAGLFKYVVKSISTKYGITPCFMAKPREGLPGNSGHMHLSLVSAKTGENLLARSERDENSPYPDVANLSDLGRYFLAGILDALPSLMPLLAPNINSYKRLVENFWAPVTVSWGLEHRAASIRLIAPPTASPKATRFEVRTCGADANPYYVLAAVLASGWRGVEKKLDIPVPPLGKGEDVGGKSDKGKRLAKSLSEATDAFMAEDSVARELFGNDFVEHFGGTRRHEIRLWDEAVTDWEVKRYIEMV